MRDDAAGAESQLTHEWVAESRAAAVNFEGNNQACVEKSQSLAGYEQCMQARGYALAQQGEDLRFFYFGAASALKTNPKPLRLTKAAVRPRRH